MFGKNEVTSPFRDPKGNLLVNEVFYTLQGEGPDAGRPAVFVRLAKCNLRCYFCDTEFEQGTPMTVRELCYSVQRLTVDNGCRLVVITGGEPLLQNIAPLVAMLNANGIDVSVETAGTVVYKELFYDWVVGERNKIICSPKTPMIAKRLIPLVDAWKYIVHEGGVSPSDGLPVLSTQRAGEPQMLFRPPKIGCAPIYVQPMDEPGHPDRNRANMLLARDIALKFGYRLSLQVHKIVEVP